MNTPPLIDAPGLRAAGRQPALPCRIALHDGRELSLLRLLRVLPGKRIVGEGEFEGRRVLAKLFVASGSERHWQQEAGGIAALLAAGIPTPAVIASSPLAGRGHALLTEFLPDATSLSGAWQALAGRAAGDAEALALLSSAVALLARMHVAGLSQGDQHLGNFLEQSETLFVIDGDSIRSAGRALATDEATANLGMLLAQLPASWDSQTRRLLDTYRTAGGCDIEADRLQREIDKARAWRVRDYLAKCVRDCTLFAVERRATRFTAVVRSIAGKLAPLLGDPDLAIASGARLKSGNTCTVARAGVDGQEIVVKRYNLKSVVHVLSRVWRRSRAWHAWREGHRLALYGIATPAPLALVEERIGPLRRRAWLVTEFCPGIRLSKHLSPDAEPPPEEAAAIVELFSILARLHVSHGDLKASNLLWHAGRIWLIDLDACTQHRNEGAWRKAWQRDRARLLRNWPAGSTLALWLERMLPPA